MRKFCWVYMDKNTGDLWLCKRPHRRAWHATWMFIREDDSKKSAHVCSFRQMLDQYDYIGRF